MNEAQCQIIQPNRTQCTNPIWATENGVDYCRLHFSYMLAQTTDVTTLVNPRTVNEEDAADLAMMLEHRIEAGKIAQEKETKQE